MEKHEKIHFITKNGFKIYPVIKNKKQAVCIEDNYNAVYKRKKVVGEYKHNTRTINKALDEALYFICERLKHETN